MNLIYSILLTQLIESRKELRQQINYFSRVLNVLAEVRKPNHIREKKSSIIKFVVHHLLLFIFNDGDHMERHKFTNESICLFDLNIQNPLVVQALSLNHLPVVDADS
mgnify:CR=1 FL=1